MIVLVLDMWIFIVGLIMVCLCFGKIILKGIIYVLFILGFDMVLKNSELYVNLFKV